MKKAIYLYVFLIFLSCSTKEKKQYQVSEKVTISGKVLNYDPEKNEINLYVNRLGLSQEHINSQLDSLGNFSASFESYIPTDIWLRYKTNFLVLTHPGDSIYLEFDGNPQQRPAILKTIKYSGDAAKTNQDAAVFQHMYYSNALYNWDTKQKTKKEYDVEEYVQYLDTLKQKSNELYEKFILDVGPNKETKVWALTYIEQDYYNALSFYPSEHQRANKLSHNDWDVPASYYEPLLNRLPLTESMFISGYALSSFINRYHYYYAMVNLRAEEPFQKLLKERESLANPLEIYDSLAVYGIIKHTPDTLLRQMVLTELFKQRFDRSEIDLFEKYRNVVDSYIQEPFLKQPLLEMYYQQKQRLENPQIASDAMLKKAANSSIKEIMDSVMFINKGKVIYLDCWATWCAPCKAEFPNSKVLMKQMESEEVAFIFMCLDSEEKGWKATLSEFQLGGQHYFLTKEQSTDMRKTFNVQGIPHYFLIDKNGTIIEKGSHLRPNVVKEKIEKLLNK